MQAKENPTSNKQRHVKVYISIWFCKEMKSKVQILQRNKNEHMVMMHEQHKIEIIFSITLASQSLLPNPCNPKKTPKTTGTRKHKQQ
jgi:hypothetical protein